MMLTLALLAIAGSTSFAAAIDDEIDALQKEFKERYPELRELKKKGIVGETSEGFVAFVEGEDADAKEVVEEENADRRKLYDLIAQKEETTADKVAERNARRNFREAEPGDYLRKNGKWQKKGKG
jgi:uncharacterized protein YdbL (DUF1318 family)